MLNLTDLQNKLQSNRKMVLIIGSLVVLLVMTIAIFTALSGPNGLSSPPLTPTPLQGQGTNQQPTPIPTDYYDLPTPLPDDTVPSTPPTPIPQPGDIILHGIAVNDFRETASRVTENGDVVIAENEEYQIIYYNEIQEFKIYITGDNFEQAQTQAEAVFLNALGLDEENACRLFVEEIVPSTAQNEHAGQILPLNFCYHEHES